MIMKYFKKAGGYKLLIQYWRNGVLGTALTQFLLLGKCRTALEILRLSVDLKTKQRLEKKYRHVLQEFESHWQKNLPHLERRTVWIFWWQGEESMPNIVKRCYNSMKENLKNWEIILLTKHNYSDYSDVPVYILEKLKCGIITLTHFSDILRLDLLIRHGGLWVDATVFCTSEDIPKSILNSNLFLFLSQKPGADGDAIPMSSWLMWAKTSNRILMATQTLLYNYWENNNRLNEYFLLHYFMSIVMDFFPEESSIIPPFCNSVPHILQLHLFDKFDDDYWNDLRQMTCFHKLTYKLKKEDTEIIGTFYDKLINGGLVKT